MEERSSQVQHMNRIYRDAARILVWLGLDNEQQAGNVFDLIRELDEILGHRPTDSVSAALGAAGLETCIRETHTALQALANRGWFRRGWIVQEIGTCTPATLYWGNATIDWDTLASVCNKLKSYHHLRKALGISTSDISFLYKRFVEPDDSTHHVNRLNFIYELQRARHLRFSDDRGRIFAFLGHYSVKSLHPLGCGALFVPADYTKTVEQTYIDAAVRILRNNPSASCIVLASVQHPPSSLPPILPQASPTAFGRILDPGKHQLPSWVPDWRLSEGTILLAEPICPHYAHGDSTADIAILNEQHKPVLRIRGVEMDIIESCSRRLMSRDFFEKRTADRPLTAIELLWRDVCRLDRFNLDDTYRNGQATFFAFMQTLSNGCVQSAGHRGLPYHDIPDSVWLRKAARYLVDSLGASEEVMADGIKAVTDVAESEDDDDRWSRWAASASEGRVFARTRSGYYVLGPASMEAGDMVCVLLGCKVPFCLRPVDGRNCFLVGECYVHGLMKGEAMEMLARKEIHERTFDLL